MTLKEWKHLLFIIVVFTAACVETDIYLPAFPDMMMAFQVSESQIQQLLTWNFIGLCLSGPFYGPTSDAWGRKRLLLFALTLFFVGSLLTVLSQQFHLMLWGRFLQGLGSGGCFTIGTAIIFDAFEEKRAIQALNQLNATIPLIISAAPLVGGYLNYAYGFRSNFWAILVLVLASLFICLFFFEETLSCDKRGTFNTKSVFQDFRHVLSSGTFWRLTCLISLLWAGYMAFLSTTSVLFVVNFGISKTVFPFFQAILLMAYILASLLSNQVVKRWDIYRIKQAGVAFITTGGLLLGTFFMLAPKNAYLLTIAMMSYVFGVSWVQTPYLAELMNLFPHIKGIVSSLLTSIRLLLGAAIITAVSQSYDGTIYPVMMAVMGIGIFTVLTFFHQEQEKLKTS